MLVQANALKKYHYRNTNFKYFFITKQKTMYANFNITSKNEGQ